MANRMGINPPKSPSLVAILIICQSPNHLVCNNIILCCDNEFSKLSSDVENFSDDRMTVSEPHKRKPMT